MDFGGLVTFLQTNISVPLWHLYKGIDSPYKSVLKFCCWKPIQGIPKHLLNWPTFKRDLLSGNTNPDHHFDPYIAILQSNPIFNRTF